MQASRRPCPFFQHVQLLVCTCFLLIVDQLVCPPLRAEPFDCPAFKPSASDARARARSQVRNSLSAAWHRRRGGETDRCATCGVEGLRKKRRFAGNASRSPSTIDTACNGSATFLTHPTPAPQNTKTPHKGVHRAGSRNSRGDVTPFVCGLNLHIKNTIVWDVELLAK